MNDEDLTQTEPVAPEVQTATVEPSLAPVPAQVTGGEPSAAEPAADENPTMPDWLPVGMSIADSDRSIQVEGGEKNIYRGDALFLFQDGSLAAAPMAKFRELIGR